MIFHGFQTDAVNLIMILIQLSSLSVMCPHMISEEKLNCWEITNVYRSFIGFIP